LRPIDQSIQFETGKEQRGHKPRGFDIILVAEIISCNKHVVAWILDSLDRYSNIDHPSPGIVVIDVEFGSRKVLERLKKCIPQCGSTSQWANASQPIMLDMGRIVTTPGTLEVEGRRDEEVFILGQ